MTHRGIAQTFVTALPALLRLESRRAMLSAIVGCRGQQKLHTVSDQAREVPELDWSVCPFDLLASPHMRACETIDRLARVSAVAGWPDKFPAWLVHGVMMLRDYRGTP